jgi:hypothetical protein
MHTYYICAYKIILCEKSYSVFTKEVTKEQLWKLTTDINHWKDWDDTVEYSNLLGAFKEGSFILKPKGGPKVKIKLIEVIPFLKFTDLIISSGKNVWRTHL